MNIAIPSDNPGGLEAVISEHFGECDVFTIIAIDQKHPDFNDLKIKIIENLDHLNCGTIVLRLKKAGADLIILNKIGPEALKVLQKEKIPLYAGKGIIHQVLNQFISNQLEEISEPNICAGKHKI